MTLVAVGVAMFRTRPVLAVTGTSTVTKPTVPANSAPVPEISTEPVLMHYEQGITVKWNVPVTGFNYTLPTGMQSRLWMEPDGKTGVITIVNYEQGQTFDLLISDALGENGRLMKRPSEGAGYIQKINTPMALKVDMSPAPGQNRVSNQSDVVFTFGEQISNPEVVAKALKIDPPIVGGITWLSPNQFKFSPQSKWGYETTVSVRLSGGPNGPTGMNSNYIDRDFVSTFITMPQKMIDLNLSEQMLYCYEDGNLFFSCAVATGKAGYRTRAGDFHIYAKDRFVDMRNSPGEEEYLVTNVPFVNWFSGGMAIHGCYWSSEYGYPRSHGCVNVTVSNAETIYNWAPLGTPVYSHY